VKNFSPSPLWRINFLARRNFRKRSTRARKGESADMTLRDTKSNMTKRGLFQRRGGKKGAEKPRRNPKRGCIDSDRRPARPGHVQVDAYARKRTGPAIPLPPPLSSPPIYAHTSARSFALSGVQSGRPPSLLFVVRSHYLVRRENGRGRMGGLDDGRGL